MSDAIFNQAVAIVLRHEGGYQADPADRGNWTSGQIGIGELKGTNHGISALSYPNEDIRGLTEDRARDIYFRDFWLAGPALLQDPGVAGKLLDIAVTMERNGRHGPAIRILQKAVCDCGIQVNTDGDLGNLTIAAANQLDGPTLLAAMRNAAVEHYRAIVAENPSLAKWLPGWEARAKA